MTYDPLNDATPLEEADTRQDIEIREREGSDDQPDLEDEQSAFGSTPNPEEVNERTVLGRAQQVGAYTEADEENPHPVDIAEEVDEAEKSRRGLD